MGGDVLSGVTINWTHFYLIIEIFGIASAIEAVYLTKSSQGAVAWGISLVSFPLVALPLYWIFGHTRFIGYRKMLGEFVEVRKERISETREHAGNAFVADARAEASSAPVFEKVADGPFLGFNELSILKNGEETFKEIFKAIDAAKKYVLCEFYIVRDDLIGNAFRERLAAAVERGVKVYFLYDAIGCYELSENFVEELQEDGVTVSSFDTVRGPGTRFQINFRNHRKIVVVDGGVAFLGGHNLGDEYLGRDESLGFWRDTHLMISGPAVIPVQAAFFSDWLWATEQRVPLSWEPAATSSSKKVLIVTTGPADELGRCRLFFLQVINSAQKRLWIASPYFVPDEAILDALQLAALRGVDVRLLLPARPDHRLVRLASFSYIPQACQFGVRVFEYQKGFLHEKVLVVDDGLASVSTANLDNRSFNLSFEITALVADREVNAQMAAMLEEDFADSEELKLSDFSDLNLVVRVGARFARLLAPIL